ncbi:hypothetical protein SISSUDRAFT_1066256 [Sistotremastrum suecicum HHB10207 ss-3]|uniref:Uncharacterized protein n=1 Tax=Sistotremastrum suecicum HHB10207 ss-3 TaxID=1314776 RepID=A0A165YIX4_9AGAM|nr:hypothetical protein SISSUDRAFT_1066256 [Sistotremastrum suecicum HHB10207 ss-3]
MSTKAHLSYITYDAQSQVPDLRASLSAAGDVFTETLIFLDSQGSEGISLRSLDPEALKDELLHPDEIVKIVPPRGWKYPTVELRLGWPEVHHETFLIDLNGRQFDYIVWQIYCLLKRAFDNCELLTAARGSTLSEELSIETLFLCSLKQVGRNIWQPFFKMVRSVHLPVPSGPRSVPSQPSLTTARLSGDSTNCRMASPAAAHPYASGHDTDSRMASRDITTQVASEHHALASSHPSPNGGSPPAASTEDKDPESADSLSHLLPISPLVASLNSLTPEDFEALIDGLKLNTNDKAAGSALPTAQTDVQDFSGVDSLSPLLRSPFRMTTPIVSEVTKTSSHDPAHPTTPTLESALWSVTPRPGFSLMFFPLWVDPAVASARSIIPTPATHEVAAAAASSYIPNDLGGTVHSPPSFEFNLSDWVNVTTPERVTA